MIIKRPSQGFLRQGNKTIYFRGTREQKSKTVGNWGTKELLGNREHRKSRFLYWGTRENADLFQESKAIGTLPAAGGPQYTIIDY